MFGRFVWVKSSGSHLKKTKKKTGNPFKSVSAAGLTSHNKRHLQTVQMQMFDETPSEEWQQRSCSDTSSSSSAESPVLLQSHAGGQNLGLGQGSTSPTAINRWTTF
ncbi:hypothetical protein ILYODFUR_007898 [Ilyodon furcidens]|uniref:Uncharacterized protein n=1 Tax=Ilyodon furcidens TaxID=33524 RepID=A0ABV0U4W6_9TELE